LHCVLQQNGSYFEIINQYLTRKAKENTEYENLKLKLEKRQMLELQKEIWSQQKKIREEEQKRKSEVSSLRMQINELKREVHQSRPSSFSSSKYIAGIKAGPGISLLPRSR
jgi:chromosome segregation ATPase